MGENSTTVPIVSDVPTIVLDCCTSGTDEASTNGVLSSLTTSSTATSIATSCSDDDEKTSREEEDSECAQFMRRHVNNLFDSSVEISTTDKHTFGGLCQTNEGREFFAKFVNKQRCNSLQVDETTFYKLAHSFALVLFECAEADDFVPGKTLMNMAFTYYHYPEGMAWQFRPPPGGTIELKSPDMKEYTLDLSGSDGEMEEKKGGKAKSRQKNSSKKLKAVQPQKQSDFKSLWKSANNWLNKEITTYKEFFKDSSVKAKPEKGEREDCNSNGDSAQSSSTESLQEEECRKFSLTPSDFGNNKKIYLYQALRHQPIWQSLRFWNAAFFDAVNGERQDHYSKLRWNSLTAEERASANETIMNITFGQLGTFINNMKHLGIGQETCHQFLRKHGMIGNLNKDLYQMLRSQVELPTPAENM